LKKHVSKGCDGNGNCGESDSEGSIISNRDRKVKTKSELTRLKIREKPKKNEQKGDEQKKTEHKTDMNLETECSRKNKLTLRLVANKKSAKMGVTSAKSDEEYSSEQVERNKKILMRFKCTGGNCSGAEDNSGEETKSYVESKKCGRNSRKSRTTEKQRRKNDTSSDEELAIKPCTIKFRKGNAKVRTTIKREESETETRVSKCKAKSELHKNSKVKLSSKGCSEEKESSLKTRGRKCKGSDISPSTRSLRVRIPNHGLET
jgi:hypothetical protein